MITQKTSRVKRVTDIKSRFECPRLLPRGSEIFLSDSLSLRRPRRRRRRYHRHTYSLKPTNIDKHTISNVLAMGKHKNNRLYVTHDEHAAGLSSGSVGKQAPTGTGGIQRLPL